MNIHAKTTVSSLTANRPNTQVKPNTGNRITAAFADALNNMYYTCRSKYEATSNIRCTETVSYSYEVSMQCTHIHTYVHIFITTD